MKTLIQNVRIVDGGSIADGGILMEDGRIAAILPRDVAAVHGIAVVPVRLI